VIPQDLAALTLTDVRRFDPAGGVGGDVEGIVGGEQDAVGPDGKIAVVRACESKARWIRPAKNGSVSPMWPRISCAAG
jgi:hypothetical protein